MITVLKMLAVVTIGYLLAGVFYGSLIGVCILLEKCRWSKGKIVAEFAIGVILTFCVSHIIGDGQYQLRNAALDDAAICILAVITICSCIRGVTYNTYYGSYMVYGNIDTTVNTKGII